MTNFIIKTLVVTAAAAFLLYAFYPRYQFIDADHRCDVVGGYSEVFPRGTYCGKWRQ